MSITSSNTFTETSRLAFDQTTGYHSQVDTKLTITYGFQKMSITDVLCLIYVMILCYSFLHEEWSVERYHQHYLWSLYKYRISGPPQTYWVRVCILTISPSFPIHLAKMLRRLNWMNSNFTLNYMQKQNLMYMYSRKHVNNSLSLINYDTQINRMNKLWYVHMLEYWSQKIHKM